MTRIFFFSRQSLFSMKTQLGFFFIVITRNPNLTLPCLLSIIYLSFFSSSNSLFLDLRLKASPMGIAAGSSNGFSQTLILKGQYSISCKVLFSWCHKP
ncbi:hypothetical protein HanXRQr2_Chr15g0713841 [Helianthus annuus]|uniref:Uncharacterized protein n=1 Tax=Helianthus annuus TaxID=4232 RepID=A0A9K3E3S9_HELAN|nr:hypothetical protein HanXRQr2_Chr15g0713841 [Helianthus annuus]KAJ0452717.1 hypothetical protein HanHA300_Chr15g0582131 [Helianthus annuus]KAJ0474627.1 hypothetical protein HanHA89_Chr15g0631881 [Helianthus annuus]KAJ0650184.1 hypothetical protein HanLR1_Chr15g0592801 [Helianthus annuus]KAJ0832987.1 hypothetical protein HanPSC8_Chr15g0685041 [Helianthus annuus]